MAIIVDGKKITAEIKEELAKRPREEKPTLPLHIIYVGRDSVIDNFINYKKRFGDAVGVSVQVHHFSEHTSEEVLVDAIREISQRASGLIVQLPLPQGLNAQNILDSVPAEKDIDVLSTKAREQFLSGTSVLVPPVAGAIRLVLEKNKVDLSAKKIVLIGNGKLVGYPTGLWLTKEGYDFSLIDKNTDIQLRNELIAQADVIISGVGIPHLVTSSMVKEGVMLVDAGTSEAGKKLLGDIDPEAAEKAALFTPVPGGIGPLTIALLYTNLFTLSDSSSSQFSL